MKPHIIFDVGRVLIDWDPFALFDTISGSRENSEKFISDIDFFALNAEFDKGLPYKEGIAQKMSEFPHYETLMTASL